MSAEIVKYINQYLTIDELEESGEKGLDYSYIVKEYFPKVMLWLDDKGLDPTEENIKNNAEELSVFINQYTLDELKNMGNDETVSANADSNTKTKSKADITKLILVTGVIILTVFFISKTN